MKINQISFKGRREDRNTIAQLTKNNEYSLTENNQTRINNAIENLSKESDESNIKFLMDTAQNLKYGTGIDLGLEPRHNWKLKLQKAAEKSLVATDPITREKLQPLLKSTFDTKKPLSPDEKELLSLRETILNNIDTDSLSDLKNKNIKDIKRNLNYFIISSETPIQQKKYILNRFVNFLSDDYKINPQLEDKKTVILAEMLNDLALNTGTGSAPNTKAINQKQHGMCAAISIARKLMSYEYKAKYTDLLLSELDANPSIMAYDLTKPYSEKKIPVAKTYVDYEDAISKGYRIVDAATTNWMQIARMYGAKNKIVYVYTPFDKANFDTFTDTFFLRSMENAPHKHTFYQALLKAQENVDTVKKDKILKEVDYENKKHNLDSDLKMITELNNAVKNRLAKIFPDFSSSEILKLHTALMGLQKDLSDDIDKINDSTKKYHYLPNEEDSVKEQKIKSFIVDFYAQNSNNFNETELNKNIKDINDLIEMSHSVGASTHIKSTITKKIAADRRLYEAAAAYRTAQLLALNDEDLLTDAMIHYELPDSETILLQKLSQIQEAVKNGNEFYKNLISERFNCEPDEAAQETEDIIAAVKDALTEQMDSLFYLLGLNDRNYALTNQVKALKMRVEENDKNAIELLTATLKMKPERKTFEKMLDDYIFTLENNPTYDDYIEILNTLGYKNQMTMFTDAFNIMADALDNPQKGVNPEIIKNFMAANNFSENTDIIDLKKKLEQISIMYNNLAHSIEYIREAFDVIDENDNLLDSATPHFYLIKEMEKEGKIVPAIELEKLRERYNAIDKLRSEDEFSSRRGKISDPSLYKYTAQEKETLKKIKKNINFMYSDINKELVSIFREIKEPLEEYARKTGVVTGDYWVGPEGGSGLSTEQETKILQQLTGKPYKIVENLNDAVETIKNTPHSGISNSNVFHDKLGAHAQYIAEIKEQNGKDILFNDNTWGDSEHENVWVDSEGLIRTDYSDGRGGETGYITDDKWRNGNYITDLTDKIGKVVPKDYNRKYLKNKRRITEEYRFPLYFETVLPGKTAKAATIAVGIKENIFLPDSVFIDDLQTLAGEKTVAELKNQKLKMEEVIKSYRAELRDIKKRIKDTPFNSQITSQSEFNALKDDDVLRLTFEKAALELSTDSSEKWKEIALAKNVTELEKIRAELRKNARERFDYAFSKDPKILYAYALDKNKSHIVKILDDALKNNGINITQEEKVKIIAKTAMYENDEIKAFDGSLAHTIDFLTTKLLRQFDAVVPDSQNARKAKEEISKKLNKDVADALYFNKNDLKKDAEINIAVKNYIDRKYDPQTDDDFVKIYKKLQDMTLDEFRIETSDVTDKDILFKSCTGFDALKMYRNENPEAKTHVANLVYQKHLLQNIELSETVPSYKYKKFTKKSAGIIYPNGKTFDDIYLTFRNSLTGLTYEKMFNMVKDDAFRNYKLLPGYPKVDVVSEDEINEKAEALVHVVNEAVTNSLNCKLNLALYELTDNLDEFFNKIPDDKVLNSEDRQYVNNIAGTFVIAFINDKTLKRSVTAAFEVLSLPENATAAQYKEKFSPWLKESNALKKNNPPEEIKVIMTSFIDKAMKDVRFVINTEYPEKYRDLLLSDLNKIMNYAKCSNPGLYDDWLSHRKLRNKIDLYSNDNINEEAKKDFLNNLALLIQKLKLANIECNQSQSKKSLSYKNMVAAAANIAANSGLNVETLLSVIDECAQDNTITAKEIYGRICEAAGEEAANSLKADKHFPELVHNLKYSYNSDSRMISADEAARRLLDTAYDKKIVQTAGDTDFENFIQQAKIYCDDTKNANSDLTNFENAKNNLKSEIDKFAENYIKPDYQRTVIAGACEIIKEEMKKQNGSGFKSVREAELEEKFKKDANKYHILNYPEEILDRFLKLCAKDSVKNTTTKQPEFEQANSELLSTKEYLEIALSLASIVDMQELLMEAVSLGNPALVSEKFKNYDTELVDNDTGMPLSMSDNRAIDYIVRSLLLDNDDNSSVNFVETLGLTDKFLKAEEELLNVKKMKEKIDEVTDIIMTTNAQTTIFADEFKTFNYDSDNDEHFIEHIDRAKENIIKRTADLKLKDNVDVIIVALEQVKADVKSNPDLSKYSIFTENIQMALNTLQENTNDLVKNLKSDLSELESIYEMIQKLYVPEYSEGYAYKKSIDEKYGEIRDYNNSSLKKVINESKNMEIVSK